MYGQNLMHRIAIYWFLLFLSFSVWANENHTAAIASAHPLATEAGLEILDRGGNAFDAAVTVTAVLAVVEPYSSGLGGGGFWLLHRTSDNKQIMIDGREMAPEKSHRDMYLDQKGEVIPKLSLDGAMAAGIPGEIAGIVHLAEHYGRLPLSETLAPAIKISEQGFPVSERYQKLAGFRLETLRSFPESATIFLADNEIPEIDYKIIQKDLAVTLRAVAENGNAGFYQGAVAKKLVQGVKTANGIWTEADLKNYKVIEREPVTGTYNGIKIISAAPPSSGGIVLTQALNIWKRKNSPTCPGSQKNMFWLKPCDAPIKIVLCISVIRIL